MTPRMTHIALQVRDVAASAAFYADYCAMRPVHERESDDGGTILWLAEPGRDRDFVFVLLPGGQGRDPDRRDFGHLGFAVETEAEVDRLAAKAEAEGRLLWPPRRLPWPVGYFCGVVDPDGNFVEFSYGQPLGPGAEAAAAAVEASNDA